MEGSKHNDELIKRKLADLSVEPRKLKFAEVHANYEKAKKDSSNKWGLYFIIGAVGIAALVSSYLLLTPSTSEQLAQNNTATEYTSIEKPILSAGTTSEDKVVERSDKNSGSNMQDNSSNSNSISEADNNSVKNSNHLTNEILSDASKNQNSANTHINTNNSTSSTTNKKTYSKNRTGQNNTDSSTNLSNKSSDLTNASTNNSYNNRKTKNNVSKTASGKQDQGKQDQKITNYDNKNETLASSGDGNDESGQNKTLGNTSNGQGKESNNFVPNKEVSKDNNTDYNSNSSSKDQDNTIAKTDSVANEPEIREPDSRTPHTIADETEGKELITHPDTSNSEAHIPGVIGTGSVSPRNKHKWLVGAEASYATIFYNAKENPIAPTQFSTGDPAFTTAYANAVGKGKHSLFTGSATFGYLYNEQVGITTGVSYFSLKTKFDIQPATTPQYSTAIDYFVWNWVQDSSVSPPTLNLQIVDTVYKQVATGSTSMGTIVNGDSAKTTDFTNKIRYISIPLNLSYNFKIGAKFSIEPQVGVIYTLPLRSQHLVATDAYKFTYNKTTSDLKRNLYYNAAIKLGYNISNKTQLYVRGGYFFRNRSIYNGDQALSMSLRSIYTSFGITYRIK